MRPSDTTRRQLDARARELYYESNGTWNPSLTDAAVGKWDLQPWVSGVFKGKVYKQGGACLSITGLGKSQRGKVTLSETHNHNCLRQLPKDIMLPPPPQDILSHNHVLVNLYFSALKR